MLQKETVEPRTLELLTELMKDTNLNAFYLVGGTALALKTGHRLSIDLDLFSNEPFDEEALSAYLEDKYRFQLDYMGKNTVKGQINGIKTDFITHAYPLMNAIATTELIRMASLEDIAAMKLNAITGNGTRLKDFVDIAFLSSHLSLTQMVHAYATKYNSRNPLITVKALSYHEDVNFSEPIQLVSGKFKWGTIAHRLADMTKRPDTIFDPLG